jgi:hypothetical protein
MLRQLSPLQWIAIVVVAVLLVKKLVKWALILGVVVVVLLLNESGALDGVKGLLGG